MMANEEKKDLEQSAPEKKSPEKKDLSSNLAPTKVAVKREDKKPNIFRRIGKWFHDMRSELKKVVWSTPKQVMNNTGIALLFMGVAALVIWAFDYVAGQTIQTLITVAHAVQ